MNERVSILIGFCLAVVLTAVPFLTVAWNLLPRQAALWLIAVAAVVQIFVHLHFFLGIRFSGTHRDRLISLLFASVLLIIMVGGSLWVMGNLNWRMM